MQVHEIMRDSAREVSKRIGRGGKRGKTSGRGGKGQTARAGNSTRPEMRDIIKKIPKLRGHGVNRARTVNSERVLPKTLNIEALEIHFEDGAEITPKTIIAKGLLRATAGKTPMVKLLARGDVTKKFTVSGCIISAGAKAKIEKAGGTVN